MIFRLLLVAVALSPLPFGSARTWAWAILASSVGILLLTWSITALFNGNIVRVDFHRTWPALITFGAAIGWAILQTLPIMPVSWHHPLWHDAMSLLGRPYHGSIAVNPGNAMAGIIRLCAYAGIFWLALQYGRDPSNAERAIAAIALSGFIYAGYGLVEYFSGNEKILWFPKYAYKGDATSTFVNRNNYATFSGLGWLCLLAIFFRDLDKRLEHVTESRETIRAIVIFFEKGGWIYLFGTATIAGALLYSHSRGGFICTILGILVFCGAKIVNRPRGRFIARWFAILCLVLVGITFIAGGRQLDERLANSNIRDEERPLIYELTLKAIGDQPLLGSGLGSFEEVFRFYRTSAIGSTFSQAHNTYLETALELGIPATILLWSALLYVIGWIVRGVRMRRRDTIYPCLGLGATALVGIHALVDFSIQIPAVAATYALILGIAFSQSWSRRDSRDT
jgi:O-antigen ligase